MSKVFNHGALYVLQRFGFKRRYFNYRGEKVYFLHRENRNKPKLTVFPGYGDTVFSWSQFLISFRKDCELYALDFPGYSGFSLHPSQGEPMTFDDYQEVSFLFLDKVVGKTDFLLGNSLGGWLGLRLAAEHSEKVDHMIAVNCGGIFTSEEEYLGIRNLFDIKNYSDFRRFSSKLWKKTPIYFYPYSILGYYQVTKKPNYKQVIFSITENHFINEQLPHFKSKLSLIWGMGDGLFLNHIPKKFMELAPKQTRYFPIESAGHMPQLETPWKFNKIIKELISS